MALDCTLHCRNHVAIALASDITVFNVGIRRNGTFLRFRTSMIDGRNVIRG